MRAVSLKAILLSAGKPVHPGPKQQKLHNWIRNIQDIDRLGSGWSTILSALSDHWGKDLTGLLHKRVLMAIYFPSSDYVEPFVGAIKSRGDFHQIPIPLWFLVPLSGKLKGQSRTMLEIALRAVEGMGEPAKTNCPLTIKPCYPSASTDRKQG